MVDPRARPRPGPVGRPPPSPDRTRAGPEGRAAFSRWPACNRRLRSLGLRSEVRRPPLGPDLRELPRLRGGPGSPRRPSPARRAPEPGPRAKRSSSSAPARRRRSAASPTVAGATPPRSSRARRSASETSLLASVRPARSSASARRSSRRISRRTGRSSLEPERQPGAHDHDVRNGSPGSSVELQRDATPVDAP